MGLDWGQSRNCDKYWPVMLIVIEGVKLVGSKRKPASIVKNRAQQFTIKAKNSG